MEKRGNNACVVPVGRFTAVNHFGEVDWSKLTPFGDRKGEGMAGEVLLMRGWVHREGGTYAVDFPRRGSPGVRDHPCAWSVRS